MMNPHPVGAAQGGYTDEEQEKFHKSIGEKVSP